MVWSLCNFKFLPHLLFDTECPKTKQNNRQNQYFPKSCLKGLKSQSFDVVLAFLHQKKIEVITFLQYDFKSIRNALYWMLYHDAGCFRWFLYCTTADGFTQKLCCISTALVELINIVGLQAIAATAVMLLKLQQAVKTPVDVSQVFVSENASVHRQVHISQVAHNLFLCRKMLGMWCGKTLY